MSKELFFTQLMAGSSIWTELKQTISLLNLPAVITNGRYFPVGVIANGDSFLLSSYRGMPSTLSDLLPSDLHDLFYTSFSRAVRNKTTIHSELKLRNTGNGLAYIHVSAIPFFRKNNGKEEAQVALLIRELPISIQMPDSAIGHTGVTTTSIELEEMRSLLQISAIEIQQRTEELQATNEELQVSIEELKTINEELQGSNVELAKRNQELTTAQDQIRERSTMLSALLENTLQSFILLDADFRILTFNPQAQHLAARLYQKPLSHGVNLLDVIHQENREGIQARLQEALDGQTIRAERSIHLHEGSNDKEQPAFYLINYTPIFNAEGQVEMISFSSLEITEEKVAKRQLADSEEMLRSIFSTADIGICLLDEHGNIYKINTGTCTLTGYAEEELLQQPYSILLPANQHAKIQELFSHNVACYKNGNLAELQESPFPTNEWLVRRKDSNVVPVIVTAAPLISPEGAFYFVLTLRDISDIVRYRDLLAATQDTVNVGGWELSIGEDGSQRLLWTKGVFDIAQITVPFEPSVEIALSYYPEPYRQQIAAALDRALTLQEPFDLELKIQPHNGPEKWVRCTGVPVTHQGRVVKVYGAFQDINKQKESEERLLQSELLYRTIAENFPNGTITVYDRDLRIIYTAGSEYNRYQPVDPATLIGKSAFDITLEENHGILRQYFNQIIEKGETVTFTLRHQDFTFQVFAQPLSFDHDGKVITMLSVSQNMSDRMRYEQQLLENEQFLSQAQEMARMGNWMYDVDTRDIRWSAGMFKLYELDESSEAPNLQFQLERIHPDDRSLFMESLNQVYFEGAEIDIDIRVRGSSDELLYVNCIARPLRDSDGNIRKVLGSVMDITGRKLSEARLSESEAWFKAAFNASRDGLIAELDGKIYACNDALARMFGYPSAEEMIGMAATEVLDQSSQQRFADFGIRRLVGQPVPDLYEAHGKKKDGSIFDIELSAAVVTIQGIQYIVTTIRDITERKRAEKIVLAQNEELVKINQELDRFVYSASHDLRAPLVSILGLINVMRMEASPDLLMAYLSMIEGSVKKLDGFVQDIAHYSFNSRADLTIEEVNMQALIEEIFSVHRETPNGQQIEMRYQETAEAVFCSDPDRLRILFNNLISNGVTYQYPGREHPFVSVRVKVDAEKAVVEVEDNGEGIHPEHVGRIFDMFFRASLKATGSGLGLYLVKETIQVLRGNIQVNSTPREGTIFTVTIPNSHKPGRR